MSKREKVKQIYKKFDIRVGEDIIDSVMENKERLENMMRLYKEQEIDSMNDIFGKEYDNKVFSEQELELASKLDLFDPYMIEVAKMIWKQKDKPIMLKAFLKIVEDAQKEDYIELIRNLKEREGIVSERVTS